MDDPLISLIILALIGKAAIILLLVVYGNMNWMASLCVFIAVLLVTVFSIAYVTNNSFKIGAEHKFNEDGWYIQPYIKGIK